MSIDRPFDVFVSCDGGSSIETHADPLVSALQKAGLHAFYYPDYQRMGDAIQTKIRTALKNSRSAILLFSKNYADSYWCLEELRLILKRDRSYFFPIEIIYCEGVSSEDLLIKDNSAYYAAAPTEEKIRKWKKALKIAIDRQGNIAPDHLDRKAMEKFFKRIVRNIQKNIFEGLKAPLQPESSSESVPMGEVATLYEKAQLQMGAVILSKSVFQSLEETLSSMKPMVREIDQSDKEIIQLLKSLIHCLRDSRLRVDVRNPLYVARLNHIDGELNGFLRVYVEKSLSAIGKWTTGKEVVENDPTDELRWLLNRLNGMLAIEGRRAAKSTKLAFEMLDLTLDALYTQLDGDQLVNPAGHLPLVKKVQVLVRFHRGRHGINIPEFLKRLERELRNLLPEEVQQKLGLRIQELQENYDREQEEMAIQRQPATLPFGLICVITLVTFSYIKKAILSSIVLAEEWKAILSSFIVPALITVVTAYIRQWIMRRTPSNDVFLSASRDILETHADPLHRALKNTQLSTFYYVEREHLGRRIEEKLREGVKHSTSAIIIFSKEYASSYWCLYELVLILERERTSLYPIIPIYCDGVSYRDLALKNESIYLEALENHKKIYGVRKVNEWKDALQDVTDHESRISPSPGDKQELDKYFERIAERIKREIIENSKLPSQPERSIGPSGVPDPPEIVIGLEDSINFLKGRLLSDDPDDPEVPYSAHELSLQKLILISAPPGCGKTTLATMLCHNTEIKGRFKSIFFVPVSRTVNIPVIVQRIYKHVSVFDVPPPTTNDDDALLQLKILVENLAPKGVLLVLDDVWAPETLVAKFMFKVSKYKLLVTSRSKHASFERSTYHLQPLCSDDANILFRHSAGCTETGGWQDEFVDKIVKVCDGFPLVLTVVGRILRDTEYYTWVATIGRWSMRQENVVNSDPDLLAKLKASVDALDDQNMTECFLDLGLFPEDQRIPTNALIDIWAVLYGFDEKGMDTLYMLSKLASRNLVTFEREGAPSDGNNPGQFVTLHDLLRNLAIYMSEEEEPTKRLFMEINGKGLCNVRTKNMKRARLLSITTTADAANAFSSNWGAMQLDMVEVLVLNLSTSDYSLPKLVDLIKLKSLVITNYCSSPAEISNFAPMINELSSLERIRLENASVPSLSISTVRLMNLKKISLNLCKISEALDRWATMFPKLEEIEIYCCPDLVHLPAGICDLISLKKLIVTSCNELSGLPPELGKLKNLQELKLNSCTKLTELPPSIGDLRNLKILDISDCVNITELPEQVGKLCRLTKLHMQGCEGFVRGPPRSVRGLENLIVTVDESKSFWKKFDNNVQTVKRVRSPSWLRKLRK